MALEAVDEKDDVNITDPGAPKRAQVSAVTRVRPYTSLYIPNVPQRRAAVPQNIPASSLPSEAGELLSEPPAQLECRLRYDRQISSTFFWSKESLFIVTIDLSTCYSWGPSTPQMPHFVEIDRRDIKDEAQIRWARKDMQDTDKGTNCLLTCIEDWWKHQSPSQPTDPISSTLRLRICE